MKKLCPLLVPLLQVQWLPVWEGGRVLSAPSVFRVREGVRVRARLDTLVPAVVPDVERLVGRRAARRGVAPEVDTPGPP